MTGCDHLETADTRTNVAETYGLDLDTIYNIAYKFLIEKADKAFHVTFDDRTLLSALSLQVKYGKCDRSKTPSVGFFDFVGKRRIAQWESLGDMSQNQAKWEFVNRINKLCPLFRSHLEAYLRNSEGNSPSSFATSREHEGSAKLVSPDPHPPLNTAPMTFIKENESAIRAALNAQTREQFMQYASQHFPSDVSKQTELIAHLQERHFHEYVAYVKQQFNLQTELSPQHVHDVPTVPSTPLCDCHPPGFAVAEVTNDTAASVSSATVSSVSCAALPNDVSQQIVYSQKPNVTESGSEKSLQDGYMNSPPNIANDLSAMPESLSNLNGQVHSTNLTGPHIHPASMWTRAALHEFKENLADAKDAVFQIGCGEVITIRVPVYPSGTSIVWEFATDDYDIGFGLFFEWTCEESNGPTHEHQQKEENDFSLRMDDASTVESTPQIEEIIPVYRRNCHKEIYCGSHVYPGMGTYLLKFDNSYSLWRQKTLYCRVYYTCS